MPTDDDLADLERTVEVRSRKLKSGRPAVTEDTAFHSVLARATGNGAEQSRRHERSILDRQTIVGAVRRRDAESAERAMRTHVEPVAALSSRSRPRS